MNKNILISNDKLNVYKIITSFWDDFSVADSDNTVKDAYDEIKDKFIKKEETNPDIWIELLLVLNHKVAYWNKKKNQNRAELYKKLLKDADDTIFTDFNWDNDTYIKKIYILNNFNQYKDE